MFDTNIAKLIMSEIDEYEDMSQSVVNFVDRYSQIYMIAHIQMKLTF